MLRVLNERHPFFRATPRFWLALASILSFLLAMFWAQPIE